MVETHWIRDLDISRMRFKQIRLSNVNRATKCITYESMMSYSGHNRNELGVNRQSIAVIGEKCLESDEKPKGKYNFLWKVSDLTITRKVC